MEQKKVASSKIVADFDDIYDDELQGANMSMGVDDIRSDCEMQLQKYSQGMKLSMEKQFNDPCEKVVEVEGKPT